MLRAIERGVRSFCKVLRCGKLFRYACRHAETHGHDFANVAGAVGQSGLLNRGADFLRDRRTAIQIRVRQEAGELLPAVACGEVAGALHLILKYGGNPAEARIPRAMSAGVVVGFEVVDIGKDDAYRFVGTPRAPPFAIQGFVESAAIGDAGQTVLERQMGQCVTAAFEFQIIARTGAHDGRLERLGPIIDRAQFQAPQLIPGFRHAGQEHDGDIAEARVRLQPLQNLVTVHVRHEDIQDNQIGPLPFRQLKRLRAVFRRYDTVAMSEGVLKQAPHHRVVVRNQDRFQMRLLAWDMVRQVCHDTTLQQNARRLVSRMFLGETFWR